jgi:hypothetical protein
VFDIFKFCSNTDHYLIFEFRTFKKQSRSTVSDFVSVRDKDQGAKITLMFRNLSHRPTAVVFIYLRNKDGGIIRAIGENDGITLL